MAGIDLPFQCTCGILRGTLTDVSAGRGARFECHCRNCRAAQHRATPDGPAKSGPVQLFQTSADHIRLDQGGNQLAVFSWSERGALRWYAACCGAMLFNTPRTPKIPFVGTFSDRIAGAAVLGPVTARVHIPNTDGTSRHEGFRHVLFKAAMTAGVARLTGRWTHTPFFDPDTFTPAREVHVPTASERESALQAIDQHGAP